MGENVPVDDIISKFFESVNSHRRLEILCVTKIVDMNGVLVRFVSIWDKVKV
ncbi:MAG: hypothetical protein IKO62_04280 [Bacteroidales bacterium]|nr:hypothetical protein [Bacteroidales bacterium]